MAKLGHIRSDNLVVQGGFPIFEGQKAAAAVTPGSLVILNGDDESVSEAGLDALNVVGVADVIFTSGQSADVDIASGKEVRVAQGIFLFRAVLKSGQNVVKGAQLGAAAAGEVYAAGSGKPIYAIAMESVDASAAAKPILALFVHAGGTVA